MILLASNSPRRKELLSLGNISFDVSVSHADESQFDGESPKDYVTRLAEAKARAVLHNAKEHHIIIGSDTAVVDGVDILGKPKDADDAVKMLKQLRGRAHQVYTGIAALRVHDLKLVTDHCVTLVPMREYSDAEIDAYVQTGDPLDKAGAYAIQHTQFQPVASMNGCYASVMGLPLCHLMKALKQLGVILDENLPLNCQAFLKYDCPISKDILKVTS